MSFLKPFSFMIGVLRRELDKLMKRAPVRMLITDLEVAELDLGKSAPIFHSARVTKADFDASLGRFEVSFKQQECKELWLF